MSSRSLQVVGLRPSQLCALSRRAKHQGTTPPEYVRLLIEKDLLADQPFDELLKPVRADFRKASASEQQLGRIVERARATRGRKRQGTTP